MRPSCLLIILFLFPIFGQAQNKFVLANEHYDTANSHYKNEEYGLARTHINQSIAYHPTPEAYYLSAILYDQAQKYQLAIASYDAVLRLEPTYSEAYFQKGILNLRYDNPEIAYADFDHLINNPSLNTRTVFYEIDPIGNQQNTVMTLQNMQARLYNYRAQASEKMGQNEAALMDFQQAIAIDQNADYYVNRALFLLKMKRLGESEQDLKRAIDLQPDHQLAWYNLLLISPQTAIPDHLQEEVIGTPTLSLFASRALEQEDYEVALKLYNRILREDSNVLALINRGRVLTKLGRYSEARADFIQAKSMGQDQSEVFYLIGNTYFFEKSFKSAIAYYDQYLSIDATYAMVWYNLSMAHLEMGNELEACHSLRKAQSLGMQKATTFIHQNCK